MQKTLFFLLSTLLISGCTWTNAFETGPGQYTISSHGSIFNSREELLMKINRKAKKACNGKPYKLEGDQNSNMITSTKTQFGDTPTSALSLVAYCEDPTK